MDLDARPDHIPRDGIGQYPCGGLLDLGGR
jgi:hypothetical protein